MDIITHEDDKEYINVNDIESYLNRYFEIFKDSLKQEIESIKSEIESIKNLYEIEDRMNKLKKHCIDNQLDFETYKEVVNFDNESDFNTAFNSIVSLTFADIKEPSAGFGDSLIATSDNGVTYGRELAKRTQRGGKYESNRK